MIYHCDNYFSIKEKALSLSDSRSPGYHTEKMVSIPERLVRCIWYDQLIDKARLKTTTGEKIKILSQGEWNCGAGPDFLDCLYQIEDEDPVRGDLELHVKSGDWKRHGHNKNPGYNDVVLHVSLWNDMDDNFVYNNNGESIPQLILADYLESDIEELSFVIDMENYPFNSDSRTGICMKMGGTHPERLVQLLEMAGRERIFLKAARMRKMLCSESYDTVLYKGLMECAGYRNNKSSFRRLAGIVPLSKAKQICRDTPRLDNALILQSIYFGVSGLFSNIEIPMWDSETRSFCELMKSFWDEYSHILNMDRMKKSDWTISGVRPAGFPVRRIAGLSILLSELLHNGGLFGTTKRFGSRLKKCSDIREIKKEMHAFSDSLCANATGYWEHRILPGGKKIDTVPALIGKSLAMTMILNIIIPLLLCYASDNEDKILNGRVLDMYSVFPKLNNNKIIRIMNHRLWGNSKGNHDILSREINNQGILQIFFDFCDQNIQDCKKCSFPKMLDPECFNS